MADTENTSEGTEDITKAWQATQDQKGQAKKLRLFAGLSFLGAIAGEIFGIVKLKQGAFNEGNLPLLIGILVAIAVLAMLGSVLWKKANRHDPASKADGFKFFVQNQLGAILTLLAFLPLIALIFMDKDMDPNTKKIAGGVGVVLAAVATTVGIDFNPPSVEQYTQDMNACAAQIKSGAETTACSPAVAAQAQEIARDSEKVASATGGQDVVYWIAPKDGEKSKHELVFHLCENVSTLRGKNVVSGSVTEAYAQNAKRLTKQLKSEQRQCGFLEAAE